MGEKGSKMPIIILILIDDYLIIYPYYLRFEMFNYLPYKIFYKRDT